MAGEVEVVVDEFSSRERGLGTSIGEARYLRSLLDALPTAVYATDADGRLTYFNQAAIDIAGRRPMVGEDRWSISSQLYRADGSQLPLEQCPMALALQERRPVLGVEIMLERPDGSRVPLMPHPIPMFDPDGTLLGGINILVDTKELTNGQAEASRRAEVQAALYRFTDRLYRAGSVADSYEAALDAILGALRCNKASILLFDQAGAMRFVASRGLSPAYLKAVDGHTPWTAGERDSRPIIIEDMSGSDQPGWLKEIVAEEGIGALAFIPLEQDGGVIGKFMAYYEAPHRFEAEELDLAVTIARQLGFSVVRERAERARRQAEEEQRRIAERLRLATQAGKVGLWDWDIEADRISWTESLFSIHGMTNEDLAVSFADWLAQVHPDDRQRVASAVQGAIDGVADYEIEMRTLRPDGQVTSLFTNAVVLRQQQKAVRMVGAAVDITERRKVEEQRDLMVAELSHRVKNTLATVISIARQSFPRGSVIDDARATFEGRLRALAQTHGRLAEGNWQSVSLQTIADDELQPYEDGTSKRFVVRGPAVNLGPKPALMLGLALHELATNAAKYGALSARGGTVLVSWDRLGDQLEVSWKEEGGPAVQPPSRTGFGRILLERALASDLRGNVAMDFAPAGLRCMIRIPVGAEHA